MAPAFMELTFHEDGRGLVSEQPWQVDQAQPKAGSLLLKVAGETQLSDLETSPLTCLLPMVFKSYSCPP